MEKVLHSADVPRKIWFLWLQGISSAPFVVQKCYESWRVHNRNWEIILLDNGNVRNYVDLPAIKMTDQAFSNVIRINLLAQYGGVWVDATCFCNKPLDTWIHHYIEPGFFAFDRPGPDRMISSWFMASSKNNYITKTLQSEVNAFWNANPRLKFYLNSRWRFLEKYLPKDPQKWFNFLYIKIFRIHPYHWFHYLFEKIYLRDEKVKQQWDASPKISADIPHSLQWAGLKTQLYSEIKNEIDSSAAPLYKLTWKYNPSKHSNDSILNYILGKPFLIHS